MAQATVSGFLTKIIQGSGGISSSNNYDISFNFGANSMFSNFLKSGYGINPLSEQQAVIVMLANEVQIPGVSMTSQDVRGVQKGINMKPAMAKVYNEMDMSFILDADSLPFKFFKAWQDFIMGVDNTLTGSGATLSPQKRWQAFGQHWYDDYTIDIDIVKLEKGQKNSTPFQDELFEPFKVKLVKAYPYMLSSIPYSSAASSVVKLSVGMYYEYAQFLPNGDGKTTKLTVPQDVPSTNGRSTIIG